MKRFIEGSDRSQISLFPERLEDYVGNDNPVRVVDGFVDQLDLSGLGFKRVDPSVTGRAGYYRSDLLKLHIYGYLNRVQSSRRLEREAARNVEVMWLIGRLVPDHKTIADFRKDRIPVIKKRQSWSIIWRTIYGDPSSRAVWDDLDDIIRAPLEHERLGEMHIRATCIDSGHHTNAVYSFCKAREGRRV